MTLQPQNQQQRKQADSDVIEPEDSAVAEPRPQAQHNFNPQHAQHEVPKEMLLSCSNDLRHNSQRVASRRVARGVCYLQHVRACGKRSWARKNLLHFCPASFCVIEEDLQAPLNVRLHLIAYSASRRKS